MTATDDRDFEQQIEASRQEIVQLAERVKRLVAKRNERDLLVQRLSQTARRQTPIGVPIPLQSFHLCSLCATDHASAAIEHVRGCAPGSKCEHCGQPAIMWVELKAAGHAQLAH